MSTRMNARPFRSPPKTSSSGTSACSAKAGRAALSLNRGMLYVVAPPIGTLGDITRRALEALKRADIIAAEDTRHSGHLLRHFEIAKPLISYHEHNEARRTEELIERL